MQPESRIRAEGADAIARLGEAITGVEGERMPPVVTTLDAHLSRTALSTERIAAVLVGASAVIGCLLGLFGLYGALSDAGRQRRREFAVRSALGARGWHIVREVLRDGLRLAAIGTVLGLLGSVLVDRWVTAVLPYADARPLLAWIAPPIVLFLAVLLASALPARRAVAVSPLSLMKEE